MSMLSKKIIILIVTILIIVASVLLYYTQVQTSWVESPVYQRDASIPAKTLVVVYSRSGNTFAAAKKIAAYFNGDILHIEAPQYGLTIDGQFNASEDADKQLTTTSISHKFVDLAAYDLIVLCSPTWWFRPPPPIWSFVENHEFSGKDVFLLMTGNSRYKQIFIDTFSALIEKQNGNFLDMLFIRRGRIFWQKTSEEVSAEIQLALDQRKKMWVSSGLLQ